MEVEAFDNVIQCKAEKLPCSYLGVPTSDNIARVNALNPIVENFKAKLSKWKVIKSFWFGGETILLKSVLGTLGTYYFFLFKAPKKSQIISKVYKEIFVEMSRLGQ